MLNITYLEDCILFQVDSGPGRFAPIDQWLNYLENVTIFNVINDLIVNGGASTVNDETVSILCEDIDSMDKFEYAALRLPQPYPFDIFVDISGSGLRDKNIKIKYSFQDFAHHNGSGNHLFKMAQRTGAHLKSDNEYLLNSQQYLLVREIEQINRMEFNASNEVLIAISNLQELAKRANAVVSKILLDTKIVSPQKISFDIETIGRDRYRLIPIIKDVDEKLFRDKYLLAPENSKEYHFKEADEKVRVVIDDTRNEWDNSLHKELAKNKLKGSYTIDEINDMYNLPSKYWDTDLIDFTVFGGRVIELGIYRPKYYPFISPYKSQWIPGIAIEDKLNGTSYVRIQNESELTQLKKLLEESQNNGLTSVSFKGQTIETIHVPPIISNAEKQLRSPEKPITNFQKELDKKESDVRVLIVKENIDLLEYAESAQSISGVDLKLTKISNLSKDIMLKDHQEIGVAWLQTLYNPPYSVPGVLLADDMGLGKTLQVLYFIEYFSQNINTKPILVVAPVTLLENWHNEYLKYFPRRHLSVELLWGDNIHKLILPGDQRKTIQNLSTQALFLTSYETLRRHEIPLCMIDWGIVILDEAQKIKTPGTLVTNSAKALKAEFKIAMTGTPVENTLMDLWCIVDYCSPGLLGTAKIFHSQYQKPLSSPDADFDHLSEMLRKQIGDSLLRRMKSDVAKDLPTIESYKYLEVMPEEQYNVYLSELSNIEKAKESEEGKKLIFQSIFNLRNISDHPYLKHYQLENIPTEELISVSSKLKKTLSILKDIAMINEKVIIFTENKSMQRILRRVVADCFPLNPSIINGDTPTSVSKKESAKLSRQQEIDKYQSTEGFNVIIMSPIAAGYGLNITEANHVIHYTRHWNPAKEQQATDRAHRIGQNKPVKVYFPMAVAPNDEIKTFDIILDELLGRKMHLASSTLFPTDQMEITRQEFMSSLGGKFNETEPILVENVEALDRMQPLVFEAALAIILERKYGGIATLTPITNDKGADIILFSDGGDYLVQVKQSSSKLGISSGQEVSYALNIYSKIFDRSFHPLVITNNYYNGNAINSAKENGVKLIDRDTTAKWVSKYHFSLEEVDDKLQKRIAISDINSI